MKTFKLISRGSGLVCFLGVICFCGLVWAGEEGAEEVAAEGQEETDTEVSDDSGESDEEESDDGEEIAEEVAQTPTVFVLPADSIRGELSEIVTERIDDSIRERLNATSGIDLLPTFDEIHSAGVQTPAGMVSEAEQQYTSAIGLINAGHYQRALQALQPAVDTMTTHIAELHNFDILTDAMANMAVAFHELDYDLDARQTIQQLAQIAPESNLDPDTYPAALRELFNDELDRIEAAGKGTVHIESDRPSAQVYINGELIGETPLTTEEVGFGEHFMVVRKGEWRWAGTIRVRARGEEQTESVELRHIQDEQDDLDALPSYYVDLRETLRSGRFGIDLEPYLAELATQTGADFVAFTLVRRDGSRYVVTPFIYRAEDPLLVEGDEIQFNLELSDARARAHQLSDIFSAAVVFMPDNRAVETVDLIGEEEEVEVVVEEETEPIDEETEVQPEDELARVDDDEIPAEELPVPGPGDDPGVGAPPPEDTGESREWIRYAGWGGAAALGAGALVTTIVLIARGSGDGVGFEAEVQW